MISSRLIASAPRSVMKTFTVRAATWKTRSSSSIWTSTLIAPALTGWPASVTVVVQRFRSTALPETAHLGLEGYRTGQCDCRHDPAKIIKDRRHGHAQHAPDLYSVGFGLSSSEGLCTGPSSSQRVGARRRLISSGHSTRGTGCKIWKA